MNRVMIAALGLVLLAGCDDKPEPISTHQPASRAPSMVTVQVCGQVNTGAEVPSPLPMGLPFALQQSVREYQLGYGKGDQSGLIGRIREQCRKEGVAL